MKEHKTEDCRCCDGKGWQYNKITGQRERCGCCGGSGKWEKPIIRFKKTFPQEKAIFEKRVRC